MTAIILDTGPLVAFLREADGNHPWAIEQFARLQPPLLTCEPVLAEAAWLIGRQGRDLDGFWAFLRRGIVRVAFQLEPEFESLAVLMARYSDIPMDLADACLVRMSELNRDCKVLTTDGDFRFYRRFNRLVVPVMAPW